MKYWYLTRTASHSHIVKSGHARTTQLHHAVTLRHIRDATMQPPSESFVEVQQHDTFLHHTSPVLAIESPVTQWLEHQTRSRRVVGSKPI